MEYFDHAYVRDIIKGHGDEIMRLVKVFIIFFPYLTPNINRTYRWNLSAIWLLNDPGIFKDLNGRLGLPFMFSEGFTFMVFTSKHDTWHMIHDIYRTYSARGHSRLTTETDFSLPELTQDLARMSSSLSSTRDSLPDTGQGSPLPMCFLVINWHISAW